MSNKYNFLIGSVIILPFYVGILLLAIFRIIMTFQTMRKSKHQKIFLITAASLCVIRVIFLIGSSISKIKSSENVLVWVFIGRLASATFMTLFLILIHFWADAYYRIICRQIAQLRTNIRKLNIFFIGLTSVMFLFVLLLYIIDLSYKKQPSESIEITCTIFLSIIFSIGAVLLIYYSIKLRRVVQTNHGELQVGEKTRKKLKILIWIVLSSFFIHIPVYVLGSDEKVSRTFFGDYDSRESVSILIIYFFICEFIPVLFIIILLYEPPSSSNRVDTEELEFNQEDNSPTEENKPNFLNTEFSMSENLL
ncbi:tobamovirus multiplication protein 1-like isoform x1 [Anaeramoeba ignava]|uniref:Tobamovirus multiplication protein 1-like isoform x1 n=1 Tax=Anaeramoeba ignava TaxID=1746090 RepID=A0A9Q0LUV9_ANAIG|nr:tobamovirus multiplication protein 1-like isoform x1 [Anaeramoeba ignava]